MSKTELLIAVFTFSICIVTWKHPFYGVSYFYLYYVLKYNYMLLTLRTFRPLFVIPLIAFVSIILSGKKRLCFTPLFTTILILFVWMCISRLMNGLDVWAGEEIDPFLKIVFFLFLLVNLIDTKEKFVFFVWVMIIAYADIAFAARYLDMTSYYMNRNNFAFMLVGATVFPLILFMNHKSKLVRLEALFYSLVLFYAIVGANSRAAYLGIVVVIILVTLSNLKVKSLLIIAIPIILLLGRTSSIHWERFDSISVEENQGGTSGQRQASWATGYRMMMRYPIFGVGSGESGTRFSEMATYEERLRVGGNVHGQELMKLHNMTLQIGAEMGVVGLALFLIIIWLSMRNIWQTRKLCRQNKEFLSLKQLNDGLFIVILALFVTGQFGNYGYSLQFYTLCCLTFCLKNIVEKENQRIFEGQPVVEKPIIPVKWETYIRLALFSVFTYINIHL